MYRNVKCTVNKENFAEWLKEVNNDHKQEVLHNVLGEHLDTAKYSDFDFCTYASNIEHINLLENISVLDTDIFEALKKDFNMSNRHDLEQKNQLITQFTVLNNSIINDINRVLAINFDKLKKIKLLLINENKNLNSCY